LARSQRQAADRRDATTFRSALAYDDTAALSPRCYAAVRRRWTLLWREGVSNMLPGRSGIIKRIKAA